MLRLIVLCIYKSAESDRPAYHIRLAQGSDLLLEGLPAAYQHNRGFSNIIFLHLFESIVGCEISPAGCLAIRYLLLE